MQKKPKEKIKIFKNGYKAEKKIFRIAILFMICLFFLSWFLQGGGLFEQQVYISCPDYGIRCDNPLYGHCEKKAFEPYCHREYFLPGEEVGKKPNFIISNGVWLFPLIFVIAFLINHFKHNKNYKMGGIE